MARTRLQFLSGAEIRRIHDTSIKVLEEVGVLVNSASVVRLLIDSGCRMSKDEKRVLMPESVIKSALAKAPKSLLLASRDGKHDMKIPTEDRTYAANGGEGVYITDLATGESRPSTTEDVGRFAALVEALDQVDFVWPMVGAIEQPIHVKTLVELKMCFESSTKHVQSMAADEEEAKRVVQLASLLTGGPDALAKRPIVSAVQCPISPLTFESGLTEGQVELAKAGIPVVAMVATVMGLTSPVTISGTLAQVNAENLASLVISQAAKKGAPWIYGSDSTPGDLRTGSIDYGALETNLVRTGAGQMGRFYGLPTMVSGLGIEQTSRLLGSVKEGVPYMMLQALVPSDLGSGFGGVDQAAGASFEQLVADAWIWGTAREFVRSFGTDDAAISFETIREAGLDGNFLGKRHTLSRFKQEFMATSNPDAVFRGNGESEPRGTLLKKAKEAADMILSAPRHGLVTKEQSAKMEELIGKWR